MEPKIGPCIGSASLGNPVTQLFDILPGSAFDRVLNRADFWGAWLVDMCAEHRDSRQAVFLECQGNLIATFIDHGHMFGGPDGSRKVSLSGPRYLDSRIDPESDKKILAHVRRIVGTLSVDALVSKIGKMPEEWVTHSAVKNFSVCLDMLNRPRVVRGMLEAMVSLVSNPAAYAKTTLTIDTTR